MGKCPDCSAEIRLSEEAIIGEFLICLNCGVELEIMGLGPIELSLAPEEEEASGD